MHNQKKVNKKVIMNPMKMHLIRFPVIYNFIIWKQISRYVQENSEDEHPKNLLKMNTNMDVFQSFF